MRLLAGFLILLSLNACQRGHADTLEEALEQLSQQHYAEATTELEAVLPKLRKAEDRNVARYALGLAHKAQKHWEEAISVFEAALENGVPVQDHPQWHIAQCYEALEDHANAARWYRSLLEAHPTSSRAIQARYRLAKAELAQERYQAVLDTYQEVPPGRFGRYIRAQAHEGLKAWQAAYDDYQQILQANPSDELARNAYERILIVLSQAKTIHPTRSQRLRQAEVLLAARQRTEARKILRKIVGEHRDKLAGKTTYLIAQSYAAQREYNDAIREYAKIRDRYSASGYLTRALYQSALLVRRKGRVSKGNQQLLDFVETYSWSALADNALYDVGLSEQRNRRYKQAISAYGKLLRKYTRSSLVGDALWNQAWSYLKLGELTQSRAKFEKLVRRYPGKDLGNGAQFWMGKIDERLGHSESAARMYVQIIEEEDWYYADRAQKRLQALIDEDKTSVSLPPRHPPIGETPEAWQQARTPPLPQLGFLLRAHAYEDALTDLEAKLSSAGENRASFYYHLILTNEKLEQYRQASLYAYRLSRLKGWRDAEGRVPEPLFKRIYPLYYRGLIEANAEKVALDPFFVAAMIREESRYQTDIVSHAGAIGLMQLMPPTARDIASRLKIRNFSTSTLRDAETSIRLGSWYMGSLMKQFNSPELVSGAYNGGPGRMQRWTKELELKDMDEFIEDVPITETRNHIKRVMHSYAMYRRMYGPEADLM